MVTIPEIAREVTRAALMGSVALWVGGHADRAAAEGTGDAATIEALQAQMAELTRQLEALKQKQAAQDRLLAEQKAEVAALPEAVAPANVVTGGDKPGSFKLPGTNTSIKIGGYIKGDLIYDADADLGDTFVSSAIPADGSVQDNRDGHFRAHARQTRINLQTWTPTDYGEVHTYIEGDFFGSGGNEVLSNSTSFRIRHAYGEFGPVMAGQNWSNFMFLDSYPGTVDFFGPAGIPFLRQGQLRYTFKPSDKLEVSVSAENSELTAISDTDGDGVLETLGSTRRTADDFQFGIDTLPDFTARASYRDDWGAVSLSGVLRQLEVDDGAAIDDEETGWAILAAGVLNMNQLTPALGNDTLVGNFTYGDGAGRYIINGFNNDAFLNSSGQLQTIESWGFAGAYTHQWTDKWSSSAVYGHYEVDDTFASSSTESLDTVHLNVMWQPNDRARFGLEWIYGERDFQDGSLDNDAQRVQFGSQFFF